MKHLGKRFLAGLGTILPVVLTAYLLYWFAASAEALLGGAIRLVLPARYYWPGMGLAVGIALVFLVGVLMQAWVVRSVFSWAERLVYRMPLVKTVYGAIRDFIGFVAQGGDRGFRQVVAVRMGNTDMKMIGFVTRGDLADLPAAIGGADSIAVYLPMSYQIGGHTVMVPRSSVEPLDMSLEAAMRLVLTAGIATGGHGGQQRPPMD
jgi:uncharacterized membrane protein